MSLGVEFVLYGQTGWSAVVGLGLGFGFSCNRGPRSVGGVTERLTYYLVSGR